MSAATETSLQEIAKEYQQLGLCAIPVEGKRPLIPWRPFVERFPTEEEWRSFPWSAATGLALVIGPATWELWPNLWCLDIEAEHRSDAEAWLDRHVPSWRFVTVVETGSGGLHVYFLADRPVRTKPIPWGEVRGQASICVLPPSKHPETGRPYQWLSERWTNLPTFNPERVPGYGENNGHRPVRELVSETIPVGQRNIVLTKAAGLLRGELGLSADELLTVLRMLNARCAEPLDERELRAIANSAQKWPQNPQLVISSNGHKLGPLGNGHQDPPVALEISALPEPEPRGWVVPDLLPEGAVSILFGDDGTGKSVVATSLALCVVTGASFLGRPVRQGKVLYVDTEFDENEFVRRVYRLARGMGLEGPPPGLWYYRTRYSLTSPGGQNDIVTLVERHRPDLVIVDSLTLGSLDVDLKEAHSAAALMEFLGRLSVTVLAIDHIPKPPPGTSLAYARPWGSFAKRARARHALLLTAAEGGGVVLRVTKSNLTATGMSVGLNIDWSGDTIRVTPVSLDDDSLAGIELHLPPIEQVYRVLAQHGPMTPDQVAEELGLAPGTVRNKLTALRQRGRVERLGDGRWQVVRPPTLVVGDGTQDSRFTGFTHYRVSESSESATKSTTACDICDGDADPGNHVHSLAFTGPGDDHQVSTTYGPDARFTGFTDSLPIVSESSESTTKSTTIPQIWRHEADPENHEHSLRFTETGEASESVKNLPLAGDFRYNPHRDAENGACNESPHSGEFRYIPHRDAECNESPGQFVSPTHHSYSGETKPVGTDFRYNSHHDADCNESPCNESPCNETPSCNESRPRNESPSLSCEVCGTRLTWSGTGRPPRYCSPACRVRGHRLRTTDQGTPASCTTHHGAPWELYDEAVIALCQQLLDHGLLPGQLDIPGGHIFDPRRFLATQLGDAKGNGYVAQIARHHLRTFLHALWSGDSSQHPESLAATTGKSQATVPSHGTPGHSPHQGDLVGDQATVPSTRVSDQVSPGQSQATVPSDEGPRCPVCRSVYELRPTDRDGWLQIRCKCRPPGEWWWVKANDPALTRKGVSRHGSG